MTVPSRAKSAQIVKELKRARSQLESAATQGMGLAPVLRALHVVERRLARPARVAILGEFNAGKSSLANALAGIDSLPTAVVSATQYPTLLYHSRSPEVWALHTNGRRETLHTEATVVPDALLRIEVGLPSPRLEAVQILDLPGLADPQFGTTVDDLTPHGVDAIIWCTVCTQAWKESEREAWGQLPKRLRERGLLIATHCDLLPARNEQEKLLARLRSVAGHQFADIIPVHSVAAAANDQEGVESPATGLARIDESLDRLLDDVLCRRNEAALRLTARITRRALARLDSSVL